MKDEDLKIEVWPPEPPPGGQSVGKISAGIKVTHIPTSLIAICETERSQYKNMQIAKAMIEYGLTELPWYDRD